MKRTTLTALLLMFLVPASAVKAGMDTALLRSLLIPGSGQAQEGRYGRAVLFAGVSIASGAGLFISQIHYNRAVERYNKDKARYIELGRAVESGSLVSYVEMENIYDAMKQAYEEADTRYKWRNVFLGTLIGAYTVNVLDMLLSSDNTPSVEIELEGDGFRLTRSLTF